MGICHPTYTNEQKEEKAQTDILNNNLLERAKAEAMVHKLLLLGAGESGKSTLFRQMIALYGSGFDVDDRMIFRPVIYSNIIMSIRKIIEETNNFSPLVSEEAIAAKEYFDIHMQEDGCVVTEEVADHMTALWKDPGFQETYRQRAGHFQLKINDSLDYFMDEKRLDEIKDENYLPSQADILRCRIRTTGIVENSFTISGSSFKMFDVGGQRNERKKWIHCFQDVRAVLFVAAISEYDQVLFEDDTMNRVHEALNLFGQIATSRWFEKTAMILFLNKCDLFREKIKRVPLTVCFPEFESPDPEDFEETTQYIQELFEEKNTKETKDIFTHVTCATDPNNVSLVFDSVRDTVLREALREADML